MVSGAISPEDAGALATASAHGSLSSLQSIAALPAELQGHVRDAFRDATRWCFLSLIPWCALAFAMALFLSNIPDGDQGRNETSLAVQEEKPKDMQQQQSAVMPESNEARE